MLNSKQRAHLRALANRLDTVLYIGKDGVTENSKKEAGDALKARELIKARVLSACPSSSREAAEKLAEATKSEVVQVIGTRFVLYRRNEKNPVIEP